MCFFQETNQSQGPGLVRTQDDDDSCDLALAGSENHVQASAVLRTFMPIALTFAALTILGNLVIVLVMRKMELRSTTVFLFKSLAIADVIFMSMGVIFGTSFYVEDRGVRTIFSKVMETLLLIPYKIALWISAFITIEKVYHIRAPIKAKVHCSKNKVKIALVTITLWIVFTAAPELGGCHLEKGVNGTYSARETTLYKTFLVTGLYRTASLGLHYVLPILLILIFNLLLVFAFRAYKRERSSFRGSQSSPVKRSMGKIQRGLFLTVLVVTMSHMVCVLIPAALGVYEATLDAPMTVCALVLRMALSTLNAATNMITYTVFLRRFRRVVMNCLCPPHRRQSSDSTRPIRKASFSSSTT